MRSRSLPLLLSAVLALPACSREIGADPVDRGAAQFAADAAAPAAPARPPVPEQPALALTSVLYSEHDAEVGGRVAGVLESISVELGDHVRAGQLLASLQADREHAEVESAQAAVDLAQLEHERASRLREHNVISQAESDQAAYRLRAARAALREATVQLEYTRVRAPFDGVVSRRFVRVGQSVEQRAPLFRVTALSPLRVLIRVPELDARRLAPGQLLRLRAVSGQEVTGRIARVAPAVDPVSGSVEMLVHVPDPGGLPPGSAVSVELPPAER